jgi:protein translocase SecG subunit
MQNYILWFEVITGGLLALVILLQNKSAGLGAALGGSDSVVTASRGVDRLLSVLTVILAILFFGGAIAALFAK